MKVGIHNALSIECTAQTTLQKCNSLLALEYLLNRSPSFYTYIEGIDVPAFLPKSLRCDYDNSQLKLMGCVYGSEKRNQLIEQTTFI